MDTRDWVFKHEKCFPYSIYAEVKEGNKAERKEIYEKIMKYYSKNYKICVRNGLIYSDSKLKGKVPALKGQRIYLK